MQHQFLVDLLDGFRRFESDWCFVSSAFVHYPSPNFLYIPQTLSCLMARFLGETQVSLSRYRSSPCQVIWTSHWPTCRLSKMLLFYVHTSSHKSSGTSFLVKSTLPSPELFAVNSLLLYECLSDTGGAPCSDLAVALSSPLASRHRTWSSRAPR